MDNFYYFLSLSTSHVFKKSKYKLTEQSKKDPSNYYGFTKNNLEKASNSRRQLTQSIELVEAERARLEARVKLLEQEVKSMRQFTGMPDLYKPATTAPKKYKNNPIKDRNLDGKKK